MEHRWGRRIVVDVPIRMTGPDRQMRTALLANLSLTGALIQADFTLRVLSRVQIVFKSSASVAAYVARRYRHGIGVEWCDSRSPAVLDLLHMASSIGVRGLERMDSGVLHRDKERANQTEFASSF